MFQMAGMENPSLGTVGVGGKLLYNLNADRLNLYLKYILKVIKIVFTIIAIFVMKRWGRKHFMYLSLSGMGASAVIVARMGFNWFQPFFGYVRHHYDALREVKSRLKSSCSWRGR